jgi:hypothetical protein
MLTERRAGERSSPLHVGYRCDGSAACCEAGERPL